MKGTDWGHDRHMSYIRRSWFRCKTLARTGCKLSDPTSTGPSTHQPVVLIAVEQPLRWKSRAESFVTTSRSISMWDPMRVLQSLRKVAGALSIASCASSNSQSAGIPGTKNSSMNTCFIDPNLRDAGEANSNRPKIDLTISAKTQSSAV